MHYHLFFSDLKLIRLKQIKWQFTLSYYKNINNFYSLIRIFVFTQPVKHGAIENQQYKSAV